MGNAPRRAERLKRETIGGEEFTSGEVEMTDAEVRRPGRVERIPTTLGVDPQATKIAKVKAINAQANAFKALLQELGASRDLSIARQRIEEAAMWAARGVINERPVTKA